MRVILFPGKLGLLEIKSVLAGLSEGVEVCGIILRDRVKLEGLKKIFPSEKLWLKNEFEQVQFMGSTAFCHPAYDHVIDGVLSDPRTYFLAERIYRKEGVDSVFNSMVKVETICWNALAVLSNENPDKVVFQATPHHIITWVFGRVSELLGIQVFFTSKTIVFPWRTRVVSGIDAQVPVTLVDESRGSGLSERGVRHVQRMKGDYESAMPEYEKVRGKRYRGDYWSTKAELSNIASGRLRSLPFRVINSIRKRYCLNVYRRLSSESGSINCDKYVLFLPNYQPERTTLPEAGRYAQQWLIVRALSVALKSVGWRLLVKEHPSTFRQRWNPTFRNSEFYKAIASIDNVDLAPLEADTFKLMDNSHATATVTGTAIVESVCRGKPVFVFGLDFHSELCGVMCVRSVVDIEKWVKKIENVRSEITEDKIYAYLASVEKNSFEIDKNLNTSVDAYMHAVNSSLQNGLLLRQ